MIELIGFIVENTIVNSAAIIPASLFIGYIIGPFLKNAGLSNWPRIFTYAVFGTLAGMWSYSSFDITDRNIENLEAIILGSSMFLFSIAIIAPVVLYQKQKKTEKESPKRWRAYGFRV